MLVILLSRKSRIFSCGKLSQNSTLISCELIFLKQKIAIKNQTNTNFNEIIAKEKLLNVVATVKIG